MAIARLEVKIGKKGKASPHASYIFREEKYAKPSDDLEKMEGKGHGNMPKWAQADPNFFWKSADEYERKNGSTYREHVIALPRELDVMQRLALVQDWIAQELADKHAYQYAIHNPIANDGKEQPHLHLMFSDRLVDDIERDPNQYFKRYNSKKPELGGAQKANTPKLSKDRKDELKAMRERWQQTCNKHLELANSNARINMKSLKDQGINRKPQNVAMKNIQQYYKAQPQIKKLETEFQDIVNEFTDIFKQEQAAKQAAKQAAAKQAAAELAAKQAAAELAAKQAAAELAAKQAAAEQQRLERAAEQQRLKRIQQKTPFELLNIKLRSITKDSYNRETEKDIGLGVSLFKAIESQKLGKNIRIVEADNSHLKDNATAQNIRMFVLQRENLTSYDVIEDYGNLSIVKFVNKYDIEHDLNDLKQFDNHTPPPTPPTPPTTTTTTTQSVNNEYSELKQKTRNDDYDFDM